MLFRSARISAIFLEEECNSKKNTKALSIMLIFLMIFLFLSMTNWEYMFKIDFFKNLHTVLSDVKIGDVSIITSLLGVNNEFGNWNNIELITIIMFFTLIIGWIYSLSLEQILDGIAEGSKKMFKTAFLMSIGSIVFTMMVSGQGASVFATISGWLVNCPCILFLRAIAS